jgi:hypothetical protein
MPHNGAASARPYVCGPCDIVERVPRRLISEHLGFLHATVGEAGSVKLQLEINLVSIVCITSDACLYNIPGSVML